MSDDIETLPNLLARLSTWRTITNDETLLSAPEAIQRAHLEASRVVSDLQEGDQDPWLGRKIRCIVRKSANYIVYLDESLEIRWWWLSRVNDQVVNTVQARVNALKHESSFLLTQKPLRLVPWRKRSEKTQTQAQTQIDSQTQTAINIRMLIGEAMTVALNSGTREDCEKVLAEAERQIAVVKDQQARPVFAGWFIFVVTLVALLTALFYVTGKNWANASDLTFTRLWLEAGLCGAFGALISAITRTRSLQLEPSAGHRGLAIEAVSRALIGAGAGLVVFFALEAGVLQAALSNDPEILRGMRLFLCIAAGASERILPSLIGKAEGVVNGGSDRNTVAGPRPPEGQGVIEKVSTEQPVG